MPITHHWHVPDKVLFVHWSGDLSLEDLAEASDTTVQYLESAPALVHLIRDDREILSTPRSLRQIVQMMQSARHPRMGWVVTIGAETSTLVQSFTRIVVRVFSLRFRRVASLSEAEAFLCKVDENLTEDDFPAPD